VASGVAIYAVLLVHRSAAWAVVELVVLLAVPGGTAVILRAARAVRG
jgi:hypothetical protein